MRGDCLTQPGTVLNEPQPPYVTRKEMEAKLKEVGRDYDHLWGQVKRAGEAFDDHEQWHETEGVPTRQEAEAIVNAAVAEAMEKHEKTKHVVADGVISADGYAVMMKPIADKVVAAAMQAHDPLHIGHDNKILLHLSPLGVHSIAQAEAESAAQTAMMKHLVSAHVGDPIPSGVST